MFNLIKMDTYRLAHSKSTWVILILSALLAMASVSLTNLNLALIEEYPDLFVSEPDEPDDVYTIGIYSDTNYGWITDDIEAAELVSIELQSGIFTILTVVFAAIFASAEQKSGYIKNIAGLFPRKGSMILSKFITIALHILLMMVVFCAATALAGAAFWGERFYLASFAPLLKFLGIQYILHLGFAALIMFFSILTRGNAFGMIFGILASVRLTALVYSLINFVIETVTPVRDFDIGNYMLETNIYDIELTAASDLIVRGIVVGIVFIVLSILLATLAMQKRDIR